MKKSALIGKTSVRDNIDISDDPRFPIFKELYKKQKQAIWFPEELNIQQDVLDYNSLSASEKEVFDMAVGYFSSSELLVGNVLVNGFFPLLIDPYAKMSFTTQMFVENIHSDFFESVMNTFEMDRSKMYKITQTDPLLREKQDIVIREVDKLTYGKGDPYSLEGRKQIIKSILLNNIVMEGIFFYSSFAHFFAMKDTGKMKNVVSGVELVLIDESLHLQNGIEAILILLDETPEMVDDFAFVEEIRNIIIDGANLEFEYLRRIFGGKTVYGLTYHELEKYLKYVTDRRLEELGFEPHYYVDQNPLKFLQKEDLKKLTNFFEVSSTEYTNF